MDSVLVDENCDWDAEAIRNAIAQAHELEEDDPDAARHLLAQAQAAQARIGGSASLEPYDPMRLYARLLRHYNGAITDADLSRMDYRRFFGYARELDLMLDEENEASKGNKKHSKGEAHAALNQFQQPEEYTGKTIRLI